MKPDLTKQQPELFRWASLLGGILFGAIYLVSAVGCTSPRPREVVLLDTRGVLPTPYSAPAESVPAEPARPAPAQPEPVPFGPLDPIIEEEPAVHAAEPIEVSPIVPAPPVDPEPEPPAIDRPIFESPPGETLSYTVQAGDSLWRIGRMHNVSPRELASYNDMDLDDVLKVGRVLRIPPGGTAAREDGREPVPTVQPTRPPDSPQPGRELQAGDKYTVRRGDSLSVIASDFGVRVRDIKELNDLTSDLIREGQTLVIPKTDQPSREPAPDVVETDDPQPRETEQPWDIEIPVEPEPATGPMVDDTMNMINHVVTEDDGGLADIASMYGVEPEVIIRYNQDLSDRTLRPGMTIKIPIF